MRTLLISVLFCVPILSQTQVCSDIWPIKTALNRADAIFIGEAKEVTSIFSYGSNRRVDLVNFRVSRYWKGNINSNMVVATVFGETSDGFVFKKGERYLVFAVKDRIKGISGFDLYTSVCMRTKSVFHAQMDRDIYVLGPSRIK